MAKPRSSRGDGACRYYDVFSPMPTKVSKQVGMVDIVLEKQWVAMPMHVGTCDVVNAGLRSDRVAMLARPNHAIRGATILS